MLRRSILGTTVTNVVIMGLTMANSVLLARLLGPAGRGDIAAAMLWPGMLIYLGSFGLFAGTLYRVAEPGARSGVVMFTSSLIALPLAALSMIVGYFIMPSVLQSQSPQVIHSSRVFLLVLPISLVALCGSHVLLGLMKIRVMNLLRLVVPCGYLIGTCVLWRINRLNVTSVILLHLALNLLFLIGTLSALWTKELLRNPKFELPLGLDMFRYGLKVHVGAVGTIVNQNMSQAMLALFASSAPLGIYVTAGSAAGVIQSLSQAVQMMAFPRIRGMSDPLEQQRLLSGILSKYCTIALAGSILYGLAFPWLLVFVFGGQFRDGILPGELLIAAFLLAGVRDIMISGAQALGQPLVGSGVQWLGALVNAGGIALLMPRLGLTGAALATLLGAAVQLGAIIYLLWRGGKLRVSECFRIDPRQLVRLHTVLMRAPE